MILNAAFNVLMAKFFHSHNAMIAVAHIIGVSNSYDSRTLNNGSRRYKAFYLIDRGTIESWFTRNQIGNWDFKRCRFVSSVSLTWAGLAEIVFAPSFQVVNDVVVKYLSRAFRLLLTLFCLCMGRSIRRAFIQARGFRLGSLFLGHTNSFPQTELLHHRCGFRIAPLAR